MSRKNNKRKETWEDVYYGRQNISDAPLRQCAGCGEYRKVSRHEVICENDRQECRKCGSNELKPTTEQNYQ